MPLIEIKQAAPATEEEAAAIIRDVTAAYAAAADVDPAKVWVLLHPVPTEHWGTGGTSLAERRRAGGAS